jgi:hypothetical protein
MYLTISSNATQEEGVASGLSLWVADIETGQARELIGPPGLILNPVFDTYVSAICYII